MPLVVTNFYENSCLKGAKIVLMLLEKSFFVILYLMLIGISFLE